MMDLWSVNMLILRPKTNEWKNAKVRRMAIISLWKTE